MREIHRPKFECKICEEIFGQNCKLEVHLKEKHNEIEMFNCEKCKKKFVLKWRLTKHQEIHYNPKVIKCHYFNNNKCCPFEEIGCMFEHAYSSMCKFGKSCSRDLCSFQHEESDSYDNLNEETDDEDFDTEVECDYCYFETKSKSELMMHVDIEHDLSCVFCEYKAITMIDLKEHKINNH